MKNIFLGICLLTGCFILAGPPDQSPKKFNLGVAAGTTIPLGGYSGSGTSSDSTHITGSAQVGIHFNVTPSYLFSKYIGGMVMVGGNINSYNGTGGVGAVTPSGPHYVGQYLAGPYFSLPLGSKFIIEVRALAGLMTSAYPKLTESATVSAFGSTYTLAQSETFKHGKAFGYSAGITGKYMFSNRFGISLNAAYSGSNMAYPSYTVNNSATSSGLMQLFSPGSGLNYNTTTTHNNVHMAIGMINISAGVVFGF